MVIKLGKNIIETFGRKTLKILDELNQFKRFVLSFIRSFKSLRYVRFRSIYVTVINQTKFSGIDALPIVAFIALMLGATVIIQATTSLPKFGIEGFLGNLMVVIIARELGPLVTALIFISRSGAAIATEVATQKQNREILSFEIMGIDTHLYIIFPRIIASVISIFSLMIIFDIVAFVGGYIISLSAVYIPVDEFIRTILDAFNFSDLFASILKSVIYGTLIPLLACYYGFQPKSKFEVPIFVSRAVIRTLSIIFVINVVISAFFYL